MKIKKTFAVLFAAAMAFSMAACTSGDDDESKKEAEVSSSEDESAESEEANESEVSSDESDTETDSEDETVSDDSSAAVEAGFSEETGTYTDSIFTMTADPSLWEFTGEVDSESCEFTYISDDVYESTANMNVYAAASSLLDGMTASDYAEYCKEMYEAMDGFEISDTTEGSFNGYDSYTFELSYAIDDSTSMTIVQVIITNDDSLAAVSYGAVDSVMDDIQPMFDAVLNTFDFV